LTAANHDEPDLNGLIAEVKRRTDEENAELRKNSAFRNGIDQPESPMNACWSGRLQVDENLLHWASDPLSSSQVPSVQHLAHLFDRWNRKIGTDVTMEKLNAACPSIAETQTEPDVTKEVKAASRSNTTRIDVRPDK
jgi:hypothetical protein